MTPLKLDMETLATDLKPEILHAKPSYYYNISATHMAAKMAPTLGRRSQKCQLSHQEWRVFGKYGYETWLRPRRKKHDNTTFLQVES
jgi:hypothetical protein